MAALGPLLVAVRVKTMVLPTLGVALFTVLTTARSVWGTNPGVTVEVLLPGAGSDSLPVTVAVLLAVPVAFTVAVICSAVLAALARLPMVQTPVPLT